MSIEHLLLGEEFYRRRRLRIQQVREQSKLIAKKIRQRTEQEKYKNFINLDAKKEKLYLERQERIVEELEKQHAMGVQKIGASHGDAINLQNDEELGVVDLSKTRGKVAAKLLRETKQKALDEKKKALDRKLQARETANEISRDKSATVAHKIKAQDRQLQEKKTNKEDIVIVVPNEDLKSDKVTANMSVQCDTKELQAEAGNIVPILLQENEENTKEPVTSSCGNNSTENTKKHDLFALSDEMPSSLRGSIRDTPTIDTPDLFKPSNVIAAYVQNRGMRLREPCTVKKSTENLQKIKDTIIKTRAAHGGITKNLCQVFESDKNPVPMWQAQTTCHFCCDMSENPLEFSGQYGYHKLSPLPRPVIRGSSPIRRSQFPPTYCKHSGRSDKDLSPCRKKSNQIPIYDHSTRDTHNVNYDYNLVDRDDHVDEDAYSQAVKEVSTMSPGLRDSNKVLNEHRHKVATTKQKVQKECEDTIAFLNMLPKQRDVRPLRRAYMPDSRQKEQKDMQQKKMEHEFKKIEKECRRRCMGEKQPEQRKSPEPLNDDSEYVRLTSDHQYSWVPVPESDRSLTIHKIPNNKKNSQSVTFDDTCSYHEYRSRHRHTPPTKENVCSKDIPETSTSENSSNGNVLEESEKESGAISDKNRIIIYKIIDSNSMKDAAKKSPMENGVVTSLATLDKELRKGLYRDKIEDKSNTQERRSKHGAVEEFTEGIYRVMKEKEENIAQANSEDAIPPQNRNCDQIIVCHCESARGKRPKEGSIDLKNSGAGDSQVKSIGSASSECSKCASTLQEQINNLIIGSTASTASYKTVESNIRKKLKEPDSNGNFYVGASGVLNDEDYEVVIQLRKKESAQLKSGQDDKVTSASQTSFQKHDEVKLTQIQEEKEIKETSKSNEIIVDSEPKEDIKETNVSEPKSRDKSPIKIFFNSKAVEVNIEKTNVPESTDNKQKVNSICTQTSFNTPTQQPLYQQVNSSTSTSYMSPPEIILPKSLKTTRKPIECIPDSNNSFTDDNIRDKYKKKYQENNREIGCKKHKSKSYRCKKHSKSVPSKRNLTKSSGDGDSNINQTLKLNSKRSSALNIVLKGYVDKVLQLKDGEKMYKVASQYCSSISTPGSSVINVSSNMENSPNYLEELRKRITREIFNNIELDLDKKREKNTSVMQVNSKKSKKALRRRVQRKHRIKSLNVTRKLNKYFHNNNGISTSSTSYTEKTNKVTQQQTQNDMCSNVSRLKFTRHNNSMISSPDEVNCNIQKEKQDEVRSNVSRSKSSRHNDNIIPRAEEVNSNIQKENEVFCSKSSRHSNCIISSADEVNSKIVIETQNEVRSTVSRPKSSKHKNSIISVVDGVKSKTSLSKPHVSAKASAISISDEVIKSKTDTKLSRNEGTKCKNKGLEKLSSSLLSSVQLNDEQNYPINSSTQTSDEQVFSADAIMMQLEKDKLQNMEKIAVLTQKCTERLSHLTRVLEEVRKKKPDVYISTTDTSSENEKMTQHSPKEVLQKAVNLISEPQSDSVHKKRKIVLDKEVTFLPHETKEEVALIRSRCKPPPVLSRANLKLPEQNVKPHELSTVVEADSPLSFGLRNNISPNNTSKLIDEKCQEIREKVSLKGTPSKINTSNHKQDSVKQPVKMLDLSKYKELMLKPFVTIEDYAKQCNMGTLDEGSNLDDIPKGDVANDEISSLHSDGSLPDGISELLKENIVYEPFKFQSMSHVNSTTISSNSSLSVSLSRNKKYFNKLNKSKLVDTSDSLSISSNPDLESSFRKLGLAWASSTLKKTKERLALSSSTSTSTNDSIKSPLKRLEKSMKCSTILPDAHKRATDKNALIDTNISKIDGSKNDTSMAMSKMVKEYLTNELAKKIIFSNESDSHYTSLYSTKFPAEGMDATSDELAELNKTDVQPATRQRTSTPVHLYKSVNYNTVSSNSNLDDLSSVKVTSSSFKNHSNSDDLSIPNYSLRLKKDNK